MKAGPAVISVYEGMRRQEHEVNGQRQQQQPHQRQMCVCVCVRASNDEQAVLCEGVQQTDRQTGTGKPSLSFSVREVGSESV